MRPSPSTAKSAGRRLEVCDAARAQHQRVAFALQIPAGPDRLPLPPKEGVARARAVSCPVLRHTCAFSFTRRLGYLVEAEVRGGQVDALPSTRCPRSAALDPLPWTCCPGSAALDALPSTLPSTRCP